MCVFTLLDQGHASRVVCPPACEAGTGTVRWESPAAFETDFVVAGRLYTAVQAGGVLTCRPVAL